MYWKWFSDRNGWEQTEELRKIIVYGECFPDMGSLVLEVLSGALMVTVGRAQVDHISRLAPNKPVNG